MAELKHVGRVIATNKKCIVAYRTLPGEAHSCLIISTENLPDNYHDGIINLVESGAGQDAYEFADALARSTFSDGSNMLRTLHATGRLVKAPTSAIEMTPTTAVAIQLSELNQIIAEQRGLPIDELAIKPLNAPDTLAVKEPSAEMPAIPPAPPAPVSEPAVAPEGTAEEQAKFYRSQADKLAKQAAQMRRLAEELVPTVKKKEQ